ncbi:hypothetical protein PRUPE_2G120900 [Prunus persica]|uniref:EF-hand domain-containing protein n=1 Tax=Prunus persica TaxID=3760 RepID=A0A251QEQ6_PRUPE|nr:hypothetical protein PRUPE_2G120900 [Prunus persica]
MSTKPRRRSKFRWATMAICSVDANGDGKISVSELGNVLKALGSSVSADELQRVMGDRDTDCDGA